MKVVTLVAWAGEHFAFAHGDLIDLPPIMAKDRIAAELAREPTSGELMDKEVRRFPGFDGDPSEPQSEPSTRRARSIRKDFES